MQRHPHLSLIAMLLLGLGTQLWAAPRYVERYSTDTGRDLDRVSVSGTITSIDGQRATLRTERGAQVTVNLGPRRYWDQRGYSLRSGVDVTVSGWGELYDDDGGFLFAGSIDGPGFYFELWDSDGYPRWADRGDYGYGWHPSFEWADRHYCGDGPRWSERGYYYVPPPPRLHVGWYWGGPPRHPHHRCDNHCRHDHRGPGWDHRGGRGWDDDDRGHDRNRRGRR
ncbi:hypothetical protein HZB60_09830 [candidate division KSB1 bacterium]|nr:hypothetical protein [candidate division KSB1 bacterium]